jgi:hypothetical protein
MSASAGPNIVEDGLVLHLDASDIKSYPGSGTVWYDRSGNDYDTPISGLTYVNRGFDFNGSATARCVTPLPAADLDNVCSVNIVCSTSNFGSATGCSRSKELSR